MNAEEKRIRESHLKFAKERDHDKTYCPSEVARELYDDWRPKMDLVRKVADQMVQQNELYLLQKDIIQSGLPSNLKDPIRLRIKEDN
ncbi:MAG: DUF3253 domain-containing protein [Weeksellaceae bacterium]